MYDKYVRSEKYEPILLKLEKQLFNEIYVVIIII